MFTIIGLGVVMASLVIGFTMAGGKIPVLIQINEYIVILGAATGSVIISSGFGGLTKLIQTVLGLLKPDPFGKAQFTGLLRMLYEIVSQTRREGLVSLEAHIDKPSQSAIFKRYPAFLNCHHALNFLTDGLRLIVDGIDPFMLDELMQADMQARHAEAIKPAQQLQKLGDAMPGYGIVAAVLGVVITMGHVSESAEVVGHHVASALVGTFLGVLMAYGILQPLSAAAEARASSEHQYLECIRSAMLAMARGDNPFLAVDFARRAVEPELRCSFDELEKAVKSAGSA